MWELLAVIGALVVVIGILSVVIVLQNRRLASGFDKALAAALAAATQDVTTIRKVVASPTFRLPPARQPESEDSVFHDVQTPAPALRVTRE